MRKQVKSDLDLSRLYSLTTAISQNLQNDDDEWEKYIVKINGRISYVDYGEEEESDAIEAGHIEAYLLRVTAAMENGLPLVQVFDSHSSNVLEAFEVVIDSKTFGVRESLQRLLGTEIWPGDVFFLDNVEILPEHRGKGLGVHAVRCLFDTYARSCAVAVTKPYPLYPKANKVLQQRGMGDPKWFKAMRYDKFKANDSTAARKLSQLWSQVGFRKIPKSSWHVWSHFPGEF